MRWVRSRRWGGFRTRTHAHELCLDTWIHSEYTPYVQALSDWSRRGGSERQQKLNRIKKKKKKNEHKKTAILESLHNDDITDTKRYTRHLFCSDHALPACSPIYRHGKALHPNLSGWNARGWTARHCTYMPHTHTYILTYSDGRGSIPSRLPMIPSASPHPLYFFLDRKRMSSCVWCVLSSSLGWDR